jgi:hypothetical protein
VAASQPSLFAPAVPSGFRYQAGLITVAEEQALAAEITRVDFGPFVMRGVEARRRVAFFGASYGREGAPPMPGFLIELREKVAAWAGIDASAFGMALINEYRPGSPIGWHRDAPQYDVVAGVSLLSSCRMKFRPYVRPSELAGGTAGRRNATHEVLLEPRSVYLMTGDARSSFEHHIPPVSALRYSVTFRSRRS